MKLKEGNVIRYGATSHIYLVVEISGDDIAIKRLYPDPNKYLYYMDPRDPNFTILDINTLTEVEKEIFNL